MNQIFKLMATAFCSAVCFGFASCSDDNDEPTPGNVGTETVFPEGVPAEIDGAKITTNAAGQVTKITDGTETVTFEYGTFSRATNYQVKVVIVDSEEPDDKMELYLQLNDKGFVSHALEVYVDEDGEDTDTWDFGYNADGQLNYMKRSEGGNEVTNITYTNGDITKVVCTDDEGDGYTYTVAYTNSTITTAIDNKGAIMLFDSLFSIDMDEMGIVYYAGLLGKATKHLPVSGMYDDNYGDVFEWTLNAQGLPTKLTEHGIYNGVVSEYGDETTFKW